MIVKVEGALFGLCLQIKVGNLEGREHKQASLKGPQGADGGPVNCNIPHLSQGSFHQAHTQGGTGSTELHGEKSKAVSRMFPPRPGVQHHVTLALTECDIPQMK